MKNPNFVNFLDNMKEYDINGILESIKQGYDVIYESSEDVVNSIKSQLGSAEENPLDQIDEQEPVEPDMNELPEEPTDELPVEPPVDDSI